MAKTNKKKISLFHAIFGFRIRGLSYIVSQGNITANNRMVRYTNRRNSRTKLLQKKKSKSLMLFGLRNSVAQRAFTVVALKVLQHLSQKEEMKEELALIYKFLQECVPLQKRVPQERVIQWVAIGFYEYISSTID